MPTWARRLAVIAAVPTLIGGGMLIARAADPSSPPGLGTITNGIAFYGTPSGSNFPAAGLGTVARGSAVARERILLPAFEIPGAGGGQDENHVVATIKGHHAGYWIIGAAIRPAESGYDQESGTLVVWLNKPANVPIHFSYLTFGIFND